MWSGFIDVFWHRIIIALWADGMRFRVEGKENEIIILDESEVDG